MSLKFKLGGLLVVAALSATAYTLPPTPAISKPSALDSVPMGALANSPEVKLDLPIASGPFAPTWASIEKNYPGTPDWLRQAKFGIWVHFGPQAFIHPGISLTVADLNNVKSNLVNSPWSDGYAVLAGAGTSSTNYVMAGPFGYVNRNYGGNYDHGNAWKSDMQADFNLSRICYFTGNTNYTQKGHDILLAWANTMTNFNGVESAFASKNVKAVEMSKLKSSDAKALEPMK